ncbi:MAG TPA: SRPBCC family protein [Devosiaceae bacterium]|nr:SRPBCC family protein [Devosiaceae bacterium]
MPVEVSNSIVIDRPRDAVAAYATEPDNAPQWYVNIKSIEWKTPRPLAVGSRLAFVARFLGRRLAYTYEVAELEPGTRFVMRTAQGPFPMETTYERADAGEGKTEMTLRNRGQPSGFSSLAAPVMAGAIDRANKRDLQAIKRIIESR